MGVPLLRVESWAGRVLDVRLPLGVVLVTTENAERGVQSGRVRRSGYRRAFLTGLFAEGAYAPRWVTEFKCVVPPHSRPPSPY